MRSWRSYRGPDGCGHMLRSCGDIGLDVICEPPRFVWRVIVGTTPVERGVAVDVDEAMQLAEAAARRLHADIANMLGGDL